MIRLGLAFSQEDVVNIFPSPAMGDEQAIAHAATRTNNGITAWVCAADHIAYELICGLSSHGIHTPKDVSVTGFDGIDTPAGFPALSTVQIPFREIGVNGTQRLIDRVKKRFGPPQHVFIDCQFKHGESVSQLSA